MLRCMTNGRTMHMDDNVLMHYGIKGMKWGKRKVRQVQSTTSTNNPNNDDAKALRKQKIKKAVKIGAAVAATAMAVYGAKKLHDVVRDKNLKRHIDIGRTVAKNLTDPLLTSNDVYREMLRTRSRPSPGFDYESRIRNNESLIRDIVKNELDKSYARAKNDSFGTALKNVVKDKMAKRRR